MSVSTASSVAVPRKAKKSTPDQAFSAAGALLDPTKAAGRQPTLLK
jgi:hypothetical protein